MSDEKETAALDKITRLYNDDRSHKFVIHLIHAFLPVYKVQKIFSEKKGRTYKCCILGEEIMSVDDMLDITMNLNMENVIKGMIDEEANKKVHEEIIAKKRGREVGYTGEHTDKYLSQSALQALVNFTEREILNENREIRGIINSMRRAEGGF